MSQSLGKKVIRINVNLIAKSDVSRTYVSFIRCTVRIFISTVNFIFSFIFFLILFQRILYSYHDFILLKWKWEKKIGFNYQPWNLPHKFVIKINQRTRIIVCPSSILMMAFRFCLYFLKVIKENNYIFIAQQWWSFINSNFYLSL